MTFGLINGWAKNYFHHFLVSSLGGNVKCCLVYYWLLPVDVNFRVLLQKYLEFSKISRLSDIVHTLVGVHSKESEESEESEERRK